MINLNKSQLQEIPFISGMRLLLHGLHGDHLIHFLFLLSSQHFQGCFSHFPPHSSLFVAFLPFLECIFPWDSAKGLCSAQVWGCRRAVRTRWGAPLHRLEPAIDTEPHAWWCEGRANVLLFHVVLAEDVLQVSFSLPFKNSLLRLFFS